MKNETFREIGYWGSIVSAALGLINIIVCFIKGIKIFDTTLQGDIMRLLAYPPEICFSTVLYKISVGVLLLALLMMFVSYLCNTDGVLKFLMIICKIIQLACVAGGFLGYFILQSISFIKMSLICFTIIELTAFILYLIDKDHRKTIIRVAILTLITVGSGIVYFLLEMLLVLFVVMMIVRLLFSIFKEPEHKNVIYDATGKVLGFWKRE